MTLKRLVGFVYNNNNNYRLQPIFDIFLINQMAKVHCLAQKALFCTQIEMRTHLNNKKCRTIALHFFCYWFIYFVLIH